jgi:RNA polymerase sigma-70 factor (ECF subfamily)
MGYVRSEAIAEELVQDVFLQIWAKHGSWRIETSLRAYLFSAVRNRCLNHLERGRVDRRWRASVTREQTGPSLSGRVQGPDEAVLSDEIRSAVHSAIDALPERARAVAILRWREGLSYAEVAEALGISRKGVENQLARVTKVLREKLAHFRPRA